MTLKKLVPVFVACFLLSLTAQAKTSETATKAETPSPSKTEANAGTTYHWYRVSYVGNTNGFIPANAQELEEADEETVDSPCNLGSDHDCIRGFITPPTGLTTSRGDAQKMTDEPKL